MTAEGTGAADGIGAGLNDNTFDVGDGNVPAAWPPGRAAAGGARGPDLPVPPASHFQVYYRRYCCFRGTVTVKAFTESGRLGTRNAAGFHTSIPSRVQSQVVPTMIRVATIMTHLSQWPAAQASRPGRTFHGHSGAAVTVKFRRPVYSGETKKKVRTSGHGGPR